MIPTLENLIYLAVGGMLGFAAGWAFNSMKYSKETAILLKKRNERGWYTHKISLFIVLTITAVAAIWTGVVNSRFERVQKDLENSTQCTETTFTEVIRILNERTSLSSAVNEADVDQSEAFAALLTSLLKNPPPSEKAQRLAFQDYVFKLSRYNQLRKEQSRNFPSEQSYETCLEGSDNGGRKSQTSN